MQIDFGRSVTFAFEDPHWASKLVVFLVVGFIPGLNVILWSGYAISLARNIIRGEEYPLPSWADWSDIAVRGLLSLAAVGLYFAPVVCLACFLLVGAAFFGGAALTLRCALFAGAVLFLVAITYLSGSGHLRFAQTDQFFHYLGIGARLRDVRTAPGVFVPLFIYQTLISFLLILLSVVAALLFLLALSVIATAGGLLGTLVLVLLLAALLGFVAIVTLAFLANGYILGLAGATLVGRA